MLYEGQTIELTKEQQKLLQQGNLFATREGYDWKKDLKHVEKIEIVDVPKPLEQNTFILNPTLLGKFISDYSVNNTKQEYTTEPGILEKNASNAINTDENILNIYVTRDLTEDEWGMFFNEAKKYAHLKLSITCAPGIILPEAMKKAVQAEKNNVDEKIPTTFFPATLSDFTAKTSCIHSDNPDKTIKFFTKDNNATNHLDKNNWLVFDISEYTVDDLLILLDAKMDRLNFKFTEREQVLTTALKAGRKVILTGEFSDELLDGLAPFLMERARNENNASSAPDQLVLISSKSINFMENIKHDVIKKEEDKNTVTDNANTLQGFETVPSEIKLTLFNPDTSVADTKQFIQSRCDAVNNILFGENKQPYVFLSGLTGVGKTSFIENDMVENNPNYMIYHGESPEKMIAWASHKYQKHAAVSFGKPSCQSEKVILFIDEANLSQRQWSEFEGLFQTPPGIVIKDKDGKSSFYPLTANHKVIFAGNPLSYGDERSLARLFQRHGNACVFEPLSTAFIYEKVIKPIFENTDVTEDYIKIIGQELLDIYQHIVELSKDEVLISPREVQMMALLVLMPVNSYLQSFSNSNLDDNRAKVQAVARFYARSIGVGLLPKEKEQAFHKKFPMLDENDSAWTLTVPEIKTEKPTFYATESRKPVLGLLHDYIVLRKNRRDTIEDKDDEEELIEAKYYGGLGGIIFEGEPGIGKSELVVQYLLSQDFIEGSLKQNYTPNPNKNIFYRIPVGMELTAKTNLLMKAFHEGSVVILDEINSAPMMEQLLNSLLMGKTPSGHRPQRPGFMVIGTQNPTYMAGRRVASTALSRRMQTCVLPPYNNNEMLEILKKKGVPESNAKAMLAKHLLQCSNAVKKGVEPPVFRDLILKADEYLTAEAKKIDAKNDAVFQSIDTMKTNKEWKPLEVLPELKTNTGDKISENNVKTIRLALLRNKTFAHENPPLSAFNNEESYHQYYAKKKEFIALYYQLLEEPTIAAFVAFSTWAWKEKETCINLLKKSEEQPQVSTENHDDGDNNQQQQISEVTHKKPRIRLRDAVLMAMSAKGLATRVKVQKKTFENTVTALIQKKQREAFVKSDSIVDEGSHHSSALPSTKSISWKGTVQIDMKSIQSTPDNIIDNTPTKIPAKEYKEYAEIRIIPPQITITTTIPTEIKPIMEIHDNKVVAPKDWNENFKLGEDNKEDDDAKITLMAEMMLKMFIQSSGATEENKKIIRISGNTANEALKKKVIELVDNDKRYNRFLMKSGYNTAQKFFRDRKLSSSFQNNGEANNMKSFGNT